MLNPRRVIAALKQNIGKVIVGKDEVIELALIAMLCKGHVLIEDVPGTGKTTMAHRPLSKSTAEGIALLSVSLGIKPPVISF